MAQSKKKGGNSGSGSAEVGLGKRLIVILYAAGIVVIGAYPIQREFGSVYNFLDIKFRQYAGTSLPGSGAGSSESSLGLGELFRRKESKETPGRAVERARLGDPEVRRLRVGGSSSGRNALESDMEHLNSNDKVELDKLIAEKAQ